MNDKEPYGKKARLIAFYLPQYHPIPENDHWWGKGFTEWTNVTRAKPLFPGHYQPRLPADLGFYDLRVPETRIAQAEMARGHGIEGFCYWHYWFAGRRLLERPFNEVLKSGEPDFPFCLGWANESWTGVWHGCSDRMLMEQTYPGTRDEETHFRSVFEAFFDRRYLTIDGRPVFHVYKPHNLPEPKRFTDHWRELAVKSGLKGIYFIGEDHTSTWNPWDNGFDASVPHMGTVISRLHTEKGNLTAMVRRARRNLVYRFLGGPTVFPYEDYVRLAAARLSNTFTQYPSVMPNWDNTPRSGKRGYVFKDSVPELFRVHLREAIESVAAREPDKRVVFIKSWNEWAEGNYLEPDQKYGLAYLRVCREETLVSASENCRRPMRESGQAL